MLRSGSQPLPDRRHARHPAPPRSKPPAATAPAPKARSPRKARPAPRATPSSTALPPCEHLVLEDEVPDAARGADRAMAGETGAASEIETRFARRLAIAFWKGERAERIEVALFDAAPRPPLKRLRREKADPLTTFDLKRFNAIRGHQAQHRPRDQPLPEGAAHCSGRRRSRQARTNPSGCGKGTRALGARPTTTFDSTCRFSRIRGKTNLTLVAAWDVPPVDRWFPVRRTGLAR